MKIVRQLIKDVIKAHPRDDFFHDFGSTIRENHLAKNIYMKYERALQTLDGESLAILKDKAARHFQDHRKGQLKAGYFNQLNEVFAYKHLAGHGGLNVRLVREDGKKISDIEFLHNGQLQSCEVKTFGISDEEALRSQGVVYSDSAYEHLSAGFMKKLSKTIDVAQDQINKHHGSGLVFVILFFDDYTLRYYQDYRRSISAELQNCTAPNIYIKVGLFGNRRIIKGEAYSG